MTLRRLTVLSKIEFGYYKGKTVGQILRHMNGKSYMTWLYFNASHIDLNQDLLNELEIRHLIMKPGTDPALFKEHYEPDLKYINKHDFILKPGLLSMIPVKKTVLSKSSLLSKNRQPWT